MSVLVNEQKKVFIQTFQNHFTIKGKEGDAGVVSRINKNKVTVYEKRYPKISGYIVNAEYVTREHNDKKYHNFNIHLTDGKEVFILSLGKKSTAATAVMQTLPSVDFTQKVELSLSYDEKAEKQSMYVSQNGNALKWSWTKGKPGNKPEWEVKTIDGEQKWDRTNEFLYFEKVLKDHLRPKMYQLKTLNDQPIEVPAKNSFLETNDPVGNDESFPTEEPVTADADDDRDLPF